MGKAGETWPYAQDLYDDRVARWLQISRRRVGPKWREAGRRGKTPLATGRNWLISGLSLNRLTPGLTSRRKSLRTSNKRRTRAFPPTRVGQAWKGRGRPCGRWESPLLWCSRKRRTTATAELSRSQTASTLVLVRLSCRLDGQKFGNSTDGWKETKWMKDGRAHTIHTQPT